DAEEIPDMIIAHAPGTIAGDRAELNAVERLFRGKKPYLYSNKWQIGHTLGAAGGMNMILGLTILQNNHIPTFPYPVWLDQEPPNKVNNILINAMGFGGNAVSVMVSRLK
ncbi:MAG TPA: beta-ketoacyl synthase, partial [Sphingobacteriaceae bacterium]